MGKGNKTIKQPDQKTTIPIGTVGALQQRPSAMPQYSRPFAAQPTGAPSFGDLMATQNMAQKRQYDPAMAMNLLKQQGQPNPGINI